MIKPDLRTAKAYLSSDAAESLAEAILGNAPWFCVQVGVDFQQWSRETLAANEFSEDSTLHLVGSAATGFSLAPEKAGAPFRKLLKSKRASDLDFCLVDQSFFTEAWNRIVRDDHLAGPAQDFDHVRTRVYWGRIDQDNVRSSERARLRRLIDTIRRTPEYRGYLASVRLYRRREDLLGYTVWCLKQLKRAVER